MQVSRLQVSKMLKLVIKGTAAGPSSRSWRACKPRYSAPKAVRSQVLLDLIINMALQEHRHSGRVFLTS